MAGDRQLDTKNTTYNSVGPTLHTHTHTHTYIYIYIFVHFVTSLYTPLFAADLAANVSDVFVNVTVHYLTPSRNHNALTDVDNSRPVEVTPCSSSLNCVS